MLPRTFVGISRNHAVLKLSWKHSRLQIQVVLKTLFFFLLYVSFPPPPQLATKGSGLLLFCLEKPTFIGPISLSPPGFRLLSLLSLLSRMFLQPASNSTASSCPAEVANYYAIPSITPYPTLPYPTLPYPTLPQAPGPSGVETRSPSQGLPR